MIHTFVLSVLLFVYLLCVCVFLLPLKIRLLYSAGAGAGAGTSTAMKALVRKCFGLINLCHFKYMHTHTHIPGLDSN